jgi:hypothetical protein
MRGSRKIKQLKLGIEPTRDHFENVALSFRLSRQEVYGFLNGTSHDWQFQSESAPFLKQIPSGQLRKYSLWIDSIPQKLSDLYNGIREAALKRGYNLDEKEEEA